MSQVERQSPSERLDGLPCFLSVGIYDRNSTKRQSPVAIDPKDHLDG